MHISVTFGSLAEMREELPKLVEELRCLAGQTASVPAASQTAAPASAAEKSDYIPFTASPASTASSRKAPVSPAPAPAGEGVVIQDEKSTSDFGDPPPVDESYRLTVKKKLSDLNHIAGANVAKDLIKATASVDRLTDVPLEKLESLMAAARAKEAEFAAR